MRSLAVATARRLQLRHQRLTVRQFSAEQRTDSSATEDAKRRQSEAKLEARFLTANKPIDLPDPQKEKALQQLQVRLQELHKAGNARAALQVAEEMHQETEKHLGAQHPATASARSNIGLQLKLLGRWNDSRKQYEQALKIYRATVGHDHASTASVHHNWGTLLRTQLHLDDSLSATDRLSVLEMSLEHLEKAYKIRLAELGAEHPHTVASRSGWGASLASQILQNYKQTTKGLYRSMVPEEVTTNGWDAAEEHLRQAYVTALTNPRGRGLQNPKTRAKTKRQKPTQPQQLNTIQTLSAASAGQNLALVLKARAAVLGDHERLNEARDLYRQVLQVREKLLPADHPDLYATKFSLAELLQAQGDEEAANAIRQEIVDTYDPPENDENDNSTT
ncbi:hypothetical protein FisN_4Hh109 [Fistulifera solaris]|uniref:Kinesin light chain n=1 Tax=Fistulifera solaris TaxID=1519565 RepID=A0A1Z5KET9_FISSO|nr:hypothetical protein FisN_4Hh109 [Fistulifera solaris]|eukprot:GAX24591.1 hypothetical protein FisN_4Hh109 [Fistulifera solaris]